MVQELMPLHLQNHPSYKVNLQFYHMLSSNIHNIINTNPSDTYSNRDLRHFNLHIGNHTSKFLRQFVSLSKSSLYHCLSCYFTTTTFLNIEMILQSKYTHQNRCKDTWENKPTNIQKWHGDLMS
jgi:hypothetical protein